MRPTISDDLLERTTAFFVAALPSLPEDGPLLAAVSGGADSVGLLHLLDRLAPRFGFPLHVGHLHHGQRAEGDADADFVREVSESLGWPITVERAEVPEIAREEKISLEVAGRRARYRFFHRVARAIGARAVVTAHHADDQAETVLMRAFRGAGNRGLQGIPDIGPLPESNGIVTVLRPLLRTTREEIAAYNAAFGLEHRIDSTNEDLRLQRNRIRREALPLAESISPGARRGLARIAREAREDENALAEWADAAWKACAVCERGQVRIERSRLPAQAALRRRIARRAVESLAPPEENGPFPEESIDRLLAWLETSGFANDRMVHESLPLKLSARLTPDRLVLAARETWLPRPEPVELRVPGWNSLPGFTSILEGALKARSEIGRFPPREGNEAVMDWNRLSCPLIVRAWEPGDRIRLLGKGGSRKLQDLFTDHHLARERRSGWPILCDAEKIVWVPGITISDTVKVTGETTRVLHVRLRNWEDLPESVRAERLSEGAAAKSSQ